MLLRLWYWCAVGCFVLVLEVSCRRQAGGLAPFPMANGSITSTSLPIGNGSLTNRLPNPCTDKTFSPPLYQFGDLNVTKIFWYDDYEGYWSVVNFTVRDVANNYSFRCAWGPRDPLGGSNWESHDCVPETGPTQDPSRALILLNLQPQSLLKNKSSEDPVRLVQYWYCDIRNGSYPEVYQSRVDLFLNVTCPAQGNKTVEYPCVVSNGIPLAIKSQWQPTGILPDTPRLIARPNPPMKSPKGLDPPPPKDCTDISFTHPDWELSDFFYVPTTTGGVYETGRLNLSLTSRATGARFTCHFVAEGAKAGQGWPPVACPQQAVGQESRSLFTVWFDSGPRELYVQEQWTCGDV
jgi:hypothetical protein